MRVAVARIGQTFLLCVTSTGGAMIFLLQLLLLKPRWRGGFGLLMQQLFRVGVLSLPIILTSGLFIGMVVALQGYNILDKFGATSQLGQLLALSVVRELGPVMSAILFAGRAGSALTAEIGLMQATQQLSCMDMMAVDPLRRIVAPRFWAGVISVPLLTILFNVVAIYGGYLIGVSLFGIDSGSFWSNMQASVAFQSDVMNGVLKSIVFGVIVTWIAVFQGFFSKPHASGIGEATTRTVVFSALVILSMDFILTALMMGGW